MAAKAFTVTYDGSSNSRENASGAVEIDGVTLAEGEPVEGLSGDQVARLEQLPHHKFTVADSKFDPKDKPGNS